MSHSLEGIERSIDDRARRSIVQLRDQAEAATVLLERRIVHTGVRPTLFHAAPPPRSADPKLERRRKF